MEVANGVHAQKVEFTPAKVKKLKKALAEAVAANQDEFVFEGNAYVVGYAKYLIQFLEHQFGSSR